MHCENPYQMGVMNGEEGTVVGIDMGSMSIEVEFRHEIKVKFGMDGIIDGKLEFSYTITVHKSQGSEFPIVVMPLVGGAPSLMTRNLLYTAVTRAREQVYLLGRSRCIYDMAANAQVKKRYSALGTFLRELAPLIGVAG